MRLTFSDRGNKRLKLALAFGSLGTGSLFGSLGGLLWMLDGPILVIRPRPFLVSGPLDAGILLGVFRAFFHQAVPFPRTRVNSAPNP